MGPCETGSEPVENLAVGQTESRKGSGVSLKSSTINGLGWKMARSQKC